MDRIQPPSVLDGARVIAYAFVEDIPYRRHGALYVDGVALEHVPRLAICIPLGDEWGVLLFHCDTEWRVVGAAVASNVASAMARAEQNYPGVAAKWVEAGTRCSSDGYSPV